MLPPSPLLPLFSPEEGERKPERKKPVSLIKREKPLPRFIPNITEARMDENLHHHPPLALAYCFSPPAWNLPAPPCQRNIDYIGNWFHNLVVQQCKCVLKKQNKTYAFIFYIDLFNSQINLSCAWTAWFLRFAEQQHPPVVSVVYKQIRADKRLSKFSWLISWYDWYKIVSVQSIVFQLANCYCSAGLFSLIVKQV